VVEARLEEAAADELIMVVAAAALEALDEAEEMTDEAALPGQSNIQISSTRSSS
jgi:hypothetical protein